MSVIAELSVPADDFPLGRAFEATPDMQVELDRIVPTGHAILPFFWVWGDDVDAFLEGVRDEDGIDDIEVLDRVDDGALVRAVWSDRTGLVEGIIESKATLLEVRHHDGVWLFRLRSPDREAVADLQQYCADNDIDLSLNWIHTLSELEAGEHYGLTDDQRGTIQTAFAAGYFDDPRETTLEELAEEFDVSPRAVSKRLRRGLRNLVAATVGGEE